MLPSFYNNNYQIVQGPGYVAILVEMIHDVRVIPLDGRPHVSGNVRQWMGDSRGHWEGNTLVVDTTNFTDKTRFRGADEKMHLVERFTRVDANTIMYEFTVDDRQRFTGLGGHRFPCGGQKARLRVRLFTKGTMPWRNVGRRSGGRKGRRERPRRLDRNRREIGCERN